MADVVSIETQIAEVKRELALRDRVYPHMVAAGKASQEEADEHMGSMRAVLNTLLWLAKHEAAIRAAVRRG